MCSPVAGGSEKDPTSLTIEEAMKIHIVFLRDSLPADCGVQFLTISISILDRNGVLKNKIVKHAFTFPREADREADRQQIHRYADQIIPFGFVSERKVDSVVVLNDSVPGWSLIKIEVAPDDDYTKFSERVRYRRECWYRVKGSRFDNEFFLGIPKVLYDSNSKDTMTYGNASAMLRFYYLNSETGVRYPVNLGIGTFGVSSPIDITKYGGGIAVSLLFDVVQASRQVLDLNIPSRFNAGFEISPFFPIARQARILINARIGYSL